MGSKVFDLDALLAGQSDQQDVFDLDAVLAGQQPQYTPVPERKPLPPWKPEPEKSMWQRALEEAPNTPGADIIKGAAKGVGRLAAGAQAYSPYELAKSAVQGVGRLIGGEQQSDLSLSDLVAGKTESPESIAPWVKARQNQRKIEQALSLAPGDLESKNLYQTAGGIAPYLLAPQGAALTGGGAALNAAVAGGGALLEGANPAEAGVAGVAGAAVPALVKWGLGPFAGKVIPETIEAARRLGIPLPASALTRSATAQTLESAGAKMIGGGKIVDRAQNAQRALNEISAPLEQGAGSQPFKETGEVIGDFYGGLTRKSTDEAAAAAAARQKIAEDFRRASALRLSEAEQGAQSEVGRRAGELISGAGEANPKTAGVSLAEGISRFKRENQIAKRLAYRADDLRGSTVVPEGTIGRFNELISDESLADSARSFLRGQLKKISPEVKPGKVTPADPLMPGSGSVAPDEITPKNARTILGVVRTLQGKGQNYLTQPWGAREQALFRELADGLKKELRDQLPEASLTALDKAEEIFQQGAKVRESKWSQQALRLAKAGQYSEIPSAIANPNIALEDIPKIFKVVGKDAANNIRATVLADVTGTLRTTTGKFDPAAIAKKVNKYGEDKLRALLTPDQFDQVMALSQESLGIEGRLAPLGQASEAALGALEQKASAAAKVKPTAGSPLGDKMAGLAGDPERLTRTLLSPSRSLSDIQKVMAEVPQATEPLRQNLMGQLVRQATLGGELTPKSLTKAINSFGRDKVHAILSPEQMQRLVDVAEVAQGLGRATRVTGGSQTAYLANIMAMVSGAPLHPGASAAALGGQVLFSRGLGSKWGQKWLTTGLGGPTAGVLSSRAGIAGIREEVDRLRRQSKLATASRK